MPNTPLHIWLIDDTPWWHKVTEATLQHWGGDHNFTGFHRGSSALLALHHSEAALRPRIILMDFYIGDERGDRVTRELRQLDSSIGIIGYSTAAAGSQAIVDAGGISIIRKHTDAAGINPSLLSWLQA